jgi:DNA topoisomerase-2
VTKHAKEKVYIPELVFGHLLTSSNYDDDVKKVTGGRNGFGAKLTNIFSKKFTVTTADTKRKLKFKQEFKNNLSEICPPKIEAYSPDCYDFTEVTFEPDLRKFKLKEIDPEMESLLIKRVYDLAGCTPNSVSVHLNGKKITRVKNFQSYVNMYFTAD